MGKYGAYGEQSVQSIILEIHDTKQIEDLILKAAELLKEGYEICGLNTYPITMSQNSVFADPILDLKLRKRNLK